MGGVGVGWGGEGRSDGMMAVNGSPTSLICLMDTNASRGCYIYCLS